MPAIPPEIFKAYDIRGRVGRDLGPEGMTLIGRAVGSAAVERGWGRMVVGRDGRLSSPDLTAALTAGLRAAGVDVLDIGLVTTPMAYFAAYELDTHCAAMVTGSHNPAHDNGLKVVLGDEALSGEAIQGLRRRIEAADFRTGAGGYTQVEVSAAYLRRIVSDVRLARRMRIAIDCGNGAAGAIAEKLFTDLGCQVESLHCEVDGRFPNHHPDPSRPENLGDLMACLAAGDAEIGLAFDGDGDRLGVVAKDGRVIYPDRLLMLFAADVLERHPGALVLFDVKSSQHLYDWIEAHGGRPMLWKSGHSLMKARMRETGAILAGEFSGHLFFREGWYGFDDGLNAAARLLDYLSRQPDPQATLHALPESYSTPEIHIPVPEGDACQWIRTLRDTAIFLGAERVIDLDGLRVEYPDGFGLVRASNTMPVITLRFEASSQASLDRITAAVIDPLSRIQAHSHARERQG